MSKVSFIRLEPILEIVRAAIWSAKIAREKPVSIMLVAQQESAKTEAMKFFRGTSTLKYFSDLTGNGIEEYKSDIESMRLRTFMLNDLTRILAHSRGVGERTLQTLATLMEEGESETASPGGRVSWQNWPKVGVVMGITPSFYRSKQGKWRQTGFMSRFLPVQFHYNESTSRKIHESIRNGHVLPEPKPLDLPEGQVFVTIPGAAAIAIEQRAIALGKEHDTYGFRYHKALRRLAMAQAALSGRNSVITEDVKKVMRWADFFGGEEMVL